MKQLFVALLVSGLLGCGTIITLSSSDEYIAKELEKHNTYCESVPRMYSGVSYDICKLNSKPKNTEVDLFVGFYLFDGLLSTVADTLVLPYTVYQQSDKGSIKIEP